ncbi:MAG: hypothetical protein AAF706_00615 [Bacteroidota bacterium]
MIFGAIIKRLGFLLELLEIKTKIIEELQRLRTRSSVPLDPEMPINGSNKNRWGIQQNLEVDAIQSALWT